MSVRVERSFRFVPPAAISLLVAAAVMQFVLTCDEPTARCACRGSWSAAVGGGVRLDRKASIRCPRRI